MVSPIDQNAVFPLEVLSPGEWADVIAVNGEPGFTRRLAELGIRGGVRLCVLRPGSPCLVQIDHARLSLRTDPSVQILVRPLTGGLS